MIYIKSFWVRTCGLKIHCGYNDENFKKVYTHDSSIKNYTDFDVILPKVRFLDVILHRREKWFLCTRGCSEVSLSLTREICFLTFLDDFFPVRLERYLGPFVKNSNVNRIRRHDLYAGLRCPLRDNACVFTLCLR